MTKRVRVFLILVSGIFGAAVITGTVAAQAVTQSYKTDKPLQVGLIVRLAPGNSGKVEPLVSSAASNMFGVVINPTDSSITLTETSSAQQAYVATSGNYNVLVDTENGAIKTGDYVAISALDGVGMRATNKDKVVLGKALSGFDGQSNSLGSANLKSSNGTTAKVQIGHIAVSLGVTHNPNFSTPAPDLPGFLNHAAQSVVGKSVSAAHIYVGLVILIVSAVIAASLLYGGVRSSITAIGRNPLSKKSIFRSMLQVTLTSLTVFIIGLLAVYLLLRF